MSGKLSVFRSRLWNVVWKLDKYCGVKGDLRNGEQALSARVVLEADGSVGDATWDFNVKKQLLTIKTATEDINNLIIFAGHDWENETETILFTGLDAQGHSVWGKRIN